MQSAADPRRAPTSLLAIHAGEISWAIPSAAVASVQPLSASASPPRLDVLALLGLRLEDASLTPRVLVLRLGDDRVAVLVHGTLALAETAEQDLLPLPIELAESAPLVSHVAVVGGRPALLVVSPERLLRAALAASPANVPPIRDSVSR